jgi:uncharacterized protein (DUF488 family)
LLSHAFFTIGHSTRTIPAFVALLEESEITLVVDVRTVPRSRTNPQYNADALPTSLNEFGIGYEHMSALGGLRGRSPDVAPGVNALWVNKSFHNYADYALSAAFQTGLRTLRDLGHERRCAIMCAELLWWRCHRRIIADYLIAAGETVFHILGPAQIQPARLTDGAIAGADDTLTYPGEPMLL